MRELKQRLLRNALFGGGARLINLAVAIPVTAYLVARLGLERFGVWALVSAITGMIGFLDLSLRTSFVKFLAEDYARADRQSVNETLAIGFWGYTLFSLLVGGVLWFGADALLPLVQIPEPLRPEARLALLLGAARFLAGLALSVFPAVCDAHLRMDWTNSLGLGALAVSVALTVGLVEAGAGLPGIAGAQLAGVLLFHGTCLPLAWRLGGPFSLAPRHVTRRGLRRLLGYSARLHLSSLCGIVNTHLDKFLLARYATLAVVGSYELALRVVANLGSLHPFLAASLLPASSHLAAAGDTEGLHRVYRRSSAVLFAAGMAPFFFVALTAPDLVTAWIGRPDPMAARIMAILCAGYLVNSLSNGMAFICQGVGRPDIQMRQSLVQLLANLLLSVALLLWIGPLGAPLGTSLALLLGAAVFVRWFHAHLGVSTWDYLKETALRPLLCAAAALLPLGLLGAWPAAATRGAALIRLATAGGLYAAVWLPLSLWLGGWPRELWPGKRPDSAPAGRPAS